MMLSGRLLLLLSVAATAGCMSAKAMRSAAVPEAAFPPLIDGTCASCSATPPDAQLTRAIEKRVAELKARGGVCSSYAAVLESSYRSGQISIRPYMWRVGSYLTSGEAKPNGEMVLAREIDSLNVGLRTLDDLVRSMEHEAAHIAFKVDNDLTSDRADEYVRGCREAAKILR
ncbi:MAG: hypothetical protein ACT4P6_08985 [Gemmatimonadaceae bacterium]